VSQLGVPEERRVVPATEVMVNGPDEVYVERKGRIVKVDEPSIRRGGGGPPRDRDILRTLVEASRITSA
jgi:hypothetical protein